jgi:hypothetical protein
VNVSVTPSTRIGDRPGLVSALAGLLLALDPVTRRVFAIGPEMRKYVRQLAAAKVSDGRFYARLLGLPRDSVRAEQVRQALGLQTAG